MLIANPIYDVAFKYLMEDAEIARRLLSEIIDEEIIELTFQPQEYTGKSDKFQIIIYRLDFKAIIQTKNGEQKKVLIELQKGKNPDDIVRFRRYLADNYKREDEIDGEQVSLPIITIYFLGFRLKYVKTPVVKVNRTYLDTINKIQLSVKEDFIEQLTHDSFVIQIMRLDRKIQTTLERVLQIFNQQFVTGDKKMLQITEESLMENDLLFKMINRLRKAILDDDLVRKMEIEDEVENRIEKEIRKAQELATELKKNQELLDKQKQKLDEQNQKLSEKERILDEQNQELSEKERILDEQKKLIEALKQQLNNKK